MVELSEARAVGRRAAALGAVADRLARLTGWRRLAAAAGLGGLATLAMPPAFVAPLLLLAFPGVLWLLEGARSRWAAFAVGWGFGFGFFVFGLYWVAFALTVDLARFFWMIPFAVAGLPALLAVFTGLATLVLSRLRLDGVVRVLAFAALWAAAEWLRGHVLTGFPWNLIGYAWVAWTPVLQCVAVIGVYGLSLLTVLVAALPAVALDRARGGWSRPGVAALAAGLALFAALGIGGAVRLAGATHDTVPGVLLRLVQPDIAQGEKWDPALRAQHVRLQLDLSAAPGARRVTQVIWPETAVPYLLEREPVVRQALAAVVPPGGLLLTGAPRAALPGAPLQYWNSLEAIDPQGTIVASYDKVHLVPFGEYVPFRGILPVAKVTSGMVDFSSGPGPRTLALPGLPPFSPLICYEAIFPGAVVDPAAEADARPAWLLNITNDAWYGHTAGPHQHFAIAQTRAVEEGLPLVRVATTGISGVVDGYGRVTAALGLGRRGVVDGELPVALPVTVYARWGDGPFAALTVVLLAGAVTARRLFLRTAEY